MSKESIVQRIISDAENEAAGIIAEAEKRAGEVIAEAESKAARNLAGTKAETEKRAKAITDGKAATARLDCAKIELAEKRRAIDAAYAAALEKLIALDEKQSLVLADRLITEYAEKGDEIVFAANYKYASAVVKLDIVKEKALKFSTGDNKIAGGFILKGKISDKDTSYAALLAADREQFVSEVAAKLFVTG
ncbi:MAG: hypothetical protein K2K80_06205 [Clostridia bacterium]|nr:hypothetical protein [Clostridia bacterium]